MSQFAPFGTLFRYFALRFVSWITLCLLGLASIISLIQTVELVRRVSLLTSSPPDINFLKMALLNLPAVIEMILPFAMLSGAMLCFSSWNRSNEFVAVRSFGQSVWAALGPALFSAFIIGMLLVTVINPIGAVTSKRHEVQMAEIFGESDSNFSVSTSGIWLRDTLKSGKLIIRGDALNAETASIINPVIYLYHNNIHMKALYKASSMQLTYKGWMLDRASRWQTDGQKTDLGNLLLPTGLDALDLRQSGLNPQSISVYLLPGFIDALERAGIPASEYRFHLYKTLSVPLLMLGIAMLAARVTLTNVSRGRRSRLFLRGAFLAIVIFIFSYFMQILGSSLQVPMSVAAWTPAIAISLVGAIILARTDES
ncbi:LptF/LptG family permease [Alphaproteobacteria bacterium]|nr:LptF/LptG family permease [Alphaproteobacteria bacterium]